MTDYNSVENHLAVISGMTAQETEKYADCIQGSIEYVCARLVCEEDCSDSRVINLCAVNAWLKIALIRETDSDGISSFSAGDVSFTRDASSLERLRLLGKLALDECSGLIADSGFSFKAV